MTVIEMMVMLHYYAYVEDFPRSCPAADDAIKKLFNLDLLEHDNDPNFERPYRVTERGAAYIFGLLNMKLPVAKTVWEVPSD